MSIARQATAWPERRPLARTATPDAGPKVDEQHDHAARAGMLRETLEVSNYSAVTHLAVAMVLGYIFWGYASKPYLVFLNVSMLILVAVTLGWTYWGRDRISAAVSETVVRRGFTVAKSIALLIGLLWSTMPALLVPSHESGYQFVAVATTAGLISDAYVVGPIMAVSTLLIVPIVAGSFIGLIQCQYPFGLYVSFLLVVYALFVLFSTKRMSELSYRRLLDRVLVMDQSQTIGLLLNEFEGSATDWLWELDAGERLRHVPARMEAAVGDGAGLLVGVTLSELLWRLGCRREQPNGTAEVLAAVALRQPFHDRIVRLETSQGTRWWCLNGTPTFDVKMVFRGYRGVGSDVTEKHVAEARISHIASHDALTRLPNRGAFGSAIDSACASVAESATRTALLCVDIDDFKAVNDAHGHTVGDMLLQEVASRLASFRAPQTEVYRLGGDEFAVLHGCEGASGAEDLASRIAEKVGRPYAIDGLSLDVGASIGIAYTSSEVQDAATLLGHADLALYSAKASGKAQWRAFDPDLERRTLRRRRLDASMRAALPAGELDLHYQPLVDIRTEQVIGVEALLRWHLPEEGWVSPAEIIPIAEATGFIADIGRWALRRACTDVLAWPGLTVAVNISPSHFRSPAFCDEVEAILAQTGLAPSRLEVEITESVLLDGTGDVAANMRRLRTSGVRLSLDDFGTGYSSLSYLSRFTFDKLKIDRSFVRELHVRDDVLAIFEAINGMASALNMAVTVEGVEQRQQIDALRSRFEGSIQGYYYSRPRPAGQIAQQIASLRDGAIGDRPPTLLPSSPPSAAFRQLSE